MRTPFQSVSRRTALVGIVLLTFASAIVARADTQGDLDDAESRLEALRSEITGEEVTLRAVQDQMNELAGQIERADSMLTETREEIRAVSLALRRTGERIGDVRAVLEERAAEAFIQGPGSDLMFLLGATSLGDLSDRTAALEALGQRDADLDTKYRNTMAELEMNRGRLDELQAAQRNELETLRAHETDLTNTFSDQQARLDRLDSLRRDAAGLVDELGEQLAAESVPAPTSSGGRGDGIPGPLYACPVPGPHAYADTFGEIHDHEGWTHTHTGNDISAPYGAPIVAPFDGQAVSGSDENAGIYVTVSGSQGFVQMLHMSALENLGSVRTGDVVGYIGTSGNASGPHTHFEWHPGNGAAADPYPQLSEVC